MASADQKTLSIPSSYEALEQLEPFVIELQQWASFSDEDQNRIMLALSEAVNNAIVHGNDLQEDKTVTISASYQDRQLDISVMDEGKGFDPESIPNPLKEQNLLNEGGRGVYLMKQYADNVIFTKNGSKVTMNFEIG
ncbi:ATP-binding protein [Aliifodinibius salicampi]|uniref:ATP-binding protein n=1 Tax=Fodinibius salicampi TaxID=1920655 RepID=A0ABT3Q1V1_9BACT|nr:ATP-binding protein [Fodinibius salicampi]MCW9714107.1 ATP-binding protein [Fodinibius salicampi]